MSAKFQVSTSRTGLRRVVKVALCDDRDEFDTELQRMLRLSNTFIRDVEGWRPDAVTIARGSWDDRDRREHQASILFWVPAISAGIIAHEATHAALHIYSVDGYRDHARASAHIHIGNEAVPYMVGDIFSRISERVLAEGYDLVPGRPILGQPI